MIASPVSRWGRLCLYAVVAIAAVMAVLSYNPRLAFHVGGILALSLALCWWSSRPMPSRRRRRAPRDLPGFARVPLFQLETHLRTLVVAALVKPISPLQAARLGHCGGLLCVSLALSLLV